MTFFDRVFKRLFPHGGITRVKESLKRNEKYQTAYQDWCARKAFKPHLEVISKAYYFRKANINFRVAVHTFRSNGANGFAVTYNPSFGPENFRFLFDYFKDQILLLNYRLKVAERITQDRGDYVEQTEKYYLKPAIHRDIREGRKANQQYGNITLEHVLVDNKPSYLKVLVAYYVDHQFSEVLEYEDLIQALLQEDRV